MRGEGEGCSVRRVDHPNADPDGARRVAGLLSNAMTPTLLKALSLYKE